MPSPGRRRMDACISERVLLGSARFYGVLQGSTGFYQVLLGSTRFYGFCEATPRRTLRNPVEPSRTLQNLISDPVAVTHFGGGAVEIGHARCRAGGLTLAANPADDIGEI